MVLQTVGIYPPNLYGMYYKLSCYGLLPNEELFPQPCESYAKSIRCPVTAWYPSTVQHLPLFVSVNYDGV
jgi:hypothetical protein